MVYNTQNLSFVSYPTWLVLITQNIITNFTHSTHKRAILFILIRLRCTCYIPPKPIPMAIKKVF